MNESDWEIYAGDYEKQFYEVLLTNGQQVKHLWPNAGSFGRVDGSGKTYFGDEVAQFRKCTCGKLGDGA